MHRNYSQYRKRFSQNFLNSGGVVKKICAFAGVDNEAVLEVGAGKGMLTRELARRAAKVYAVELDRTLAENLADLGYANVEVVNADILNTELAKFGCAVVIGNLPYAITAKIIETLARQKQYFDRAILTVQREYAQKMLARPGENGYDPMSIFVNYHFSPKKGFTIPAHYFTPRPKVNSMVVALEKKPKEFILENEERFFDFIKGIFRYRRKQMKNAIHNYLDMVPDNIDGDILTKRPDDLPARDFYKLYTLISRSIASSSKTCTDCGRERGGKIF